jgi:hypothetical protein
VLVQAANGSASGARLSVLARPDLNVELGRVEVEQELYGGRQYHQVGESDAGEEQEG